MIFGMRMPFPTVSQLLISVLATLCALGCLDMPTPSEHDPLEVSVVMDAYVDVGVVTSDARREMTLDQRINIKMPDADVPDANPSQPSDATLVDMRQVDAVVELCGDGIVQVGEECDPGRPSDTCSDQCLRIECGNNRVDPGEACDDGNSNQDDGCFQDCQVYFPEQWTPVLVDPVLESLALSHNSCTRHSPAEFEGIDQIRGEYHGRYAYLMWARKHFHWASWGNPLTVPTRVSINAYVPDGYERRLRLNLTDVDGRCDDSPHGLAFIHQDREGMGHPLVEVVVELDDRNMGELPGSGVPDGWINMAFEIHPPSGYVRVFYNDQRVAQVRLQQQSAPKAVRIYGRYRDGAEVRGPIAVEGLTIEHGVP